MNSQSSCAPIPLHREIPKTCDKHGAYTAKQLETLPDCLPLITSCPTCAAEARAVEQQRAEADERRQRDHRMESLRVRSGIPARFRDRTLENYRAETDRQKFAISVAKRMTRSIIDEPHKGASLVFCGNPGTGKTHIACAIGHELIGALRSVHFGTVLSAVRHVKETYRRDSERSESDAIADLCAPDLLILDEVGVQVGSEHEKMIVFEIINERYQECKSTILISNLTRDELTAYIGERVMDRFAESGAVIAFDWASHRRAA